MDSAGTPDRPHRGPQAPGPRPDHPPTGVLAAVPPRPSTPPAVHAQPSAAPAPIPEPAAAPDDAAAAESELATGIAPEAAVEPPAVSAAETEPEATAATTPDDVLPVPGAATLPEPDGAATSPQPDGAAPSAPTPDPSDSDASDAPAADPSAPEPMELDTSPAAVLRSAVAVVPGVVAVGEPASRAIGRLRSAIGLSDQAGVSLTEGSEQMAVDLSIVASLARPLRGTALAVQAAALASLAESGRDVVEVNVDVLDAEAPAAEGAEDVALGALPPAAPVGFVGAPTSVAPGAPGAPGAPLSEATVPGHIRISSRALRSAATHLASEIFDVPAAKIGVNFSDEASDLALRLTFPLPVQPLTLEADPGLSVRERALTLRGPLRERFTSLTGTALTRVDVRVSAGLTPTTSGAA